MPSLEGGVMSEEQLSDFLGQLEVHAKNKAELYDGMVWGL